MAWRAAEAEAGSASGGASPRLPPSQALLASPLAGNTSASRLWLQDFHRPWEAPAPAPSPAPPWSNALGSGSSPSSVMQLQVMPSLGDVPTAAATAFGALPVAASPWARCVVRGGAWLGGGCVYMGRGPRVGRAAPHRAPLLLEPLSPRLRFVP